ncbi:MAG: gamma-glutamylcyclotransferase [Oscillospiraceae bacterium]
MCALRNGIRNCTDKRRRKSFRCWSVSASDEAALDCYEGVRSECYKKSTVSVFTEKRANQVNALVYISLRGKNQGARVGGYLEKIIIAARSFGFDEHYLGMLKDIWGGYTNEDYRT